MYGLLAQPSRSGIFAYVQRMVLIGACLLAAGGFYQTAAGATLAQLLTGGSINIGNNRFSNWQLVSSSSTAAAPDLSQIMVTPLVNDPSNPGLQFVANGQLTASGTNSIDLVFKFRVDAAPGGKTFTNHALALTGITFGATGGLADITDEIGGSSGIGLDPAVVFADKESNFTQSSSASVFGPQSTIFVTTNVFINGLAATDTVNLASFTQRFSQTGGAFAPADFDEDGDVDGADLAKWKVGVGATTNATHLQGDADGDHDIDGADFLVWQRQLGSSTLAVSANAPVPEPATLPLVLMATACIRRMGGRMRQELINA